MLKNQPHVIDSDRFDSILMNYWLEIRNSMRNIEKLPSLPTFNVEYFALYHNRSLDHKLGFQLKPPEGNPQEFDLLINNHYPNSRAIFTDGSINSQEMWGGMGVVSLDYPHLNRAISVNPIRSIFSVEMSAVAEAIQFIQVNELQGNFIICTDSLSSVNNLKHRGLVGFEFPSSLTTLNNNSILPL